MKSLEYGVGELHDELLALVGPDSFLKLVESYGGNRIYVPHGARQDFDYDLSQKIGSEAAEKMMREYPGLQLRIPLAREFRVKRYNEDGLSNGEIAVRMVMSRSGVERIISRIRKRERSET